VVLGVLFSDVACLGRGTVIDSFREAGGRGRVVRVVLHEGTVKIGQACVAGEVCFCNTCCMD
jgi:translation initiation factor IF-2